MKVLSLTEPYAALIKENIKKIETRSWKTNYRGEIYIHASLTPISKEAKNNDKLMSLVNNMDLSFGNIICKCNLVDCIYMDKEFVEKIKQNNPAEYTCGEYEVGRYAWLLENVEPLKEVIASKGELGIWNYYSEKEIMNIMGKIEYGWVDNKKNKYYEPDELFLDNYILQSPKEILKSKIGVCWDQVELERYLFRNHKLNIKTYFICHYDNDKCPTHTFLVYEKYNKFYWFEHSWDKYKGIHEFKNERELLESIREKFIKDQLNNNYNEENLLIREYSKPISGITVVEFCKHCEQNQPIILEDRYERINK
ncbi:MAG: ASCH domain-containing protein [Ignavibacteriales bacterium]